MEKDARRELMNKLMIVWDCSFYQQIGFDGFVPIGSINGHSSASAVLGTR